MRAGGVIAYPTEGVYGLGCDPEDFEAVLRLLAIKDRPWQRGLIVIGADRAQLARYIGTLTAGQERRLGESWPGAMTWIVPAAPDTPPWLTGTHAGLAVRVPGHTLARDLCRACRTPLVSTSANPSGRPAARSALAVRRALGDTLDYVLPGAVGGRAGPSELRDLRTNRVLRS